MEDTDSLAKKSEAYTYISDVYNNKVELDPIALEQAKAQFTEDELISISFAPLHDIGDCFPGIAKKCQENNCETTCSHSSS
jgi:hypothetical protein